MGYAMCLAPCVACKRPFSFNPHKVPSIRVGGEGEKMPLCESCYARWNQIHRIDKGLPPIPAMDGAYEPVEEHEL